MTARIMYLDTMHSWALDANLQEDFIVFAIQQGLTRVILYTGGASSIRMIPEHSTEMAAFISRMRSINLEVYVAVGGNSEVDRIKTFHQNFAPVDGIVLEYEWWNHSPRDFSAGMAIVDYARAQVPAWKCGVYAGTFLKNTTNLNLDEYHQVTLHADFVQIHSYNDSPNKAFPYTQARLTEFARCVNKIPIIPLLSTEWRDDSTGAHVICDQGPSNPTYYDRMCFLGKWLQTHQLTEAETIYRDAYNAWSLKDQVNLQDAFAYFAYTHTKLNMGWMRIPVNLNLTSSATTSSSVIIFRQGPLTCSMQSTASTPTNTPWLCSKPISGTLSSDSVTTLTSLQSRKELGLNLVSGSETNEIVGGGRIVFELPMFSSSTTRGGSVEIAPEIQINLDLYSDTDTSTPSVALTKPVSLDLQSTSSTTSSMLTSIGIIYTDCVMTSTSSSSSPGMLAPLMTIGTWNSTSETSSAEISLSGFTYQIEMSLNSRLDASSISPLALKKNLSISSNSALESSDAASVTVSRDLQLGLSSTLVSSDASWGLETIALAVDMNPALATSTPTMTMRRQLSSVMVSAVETSSAASMTVSRALQLGLTSTLVSGDAFWDYESINLSVDMISAMVTYSPVLASKKVVTLTTNSTSSTSGASISLEKRLVQDLQSTSVTDEVGFFNEGIQLTLQSASSTSTDSMLRSNKRIALACRSNLSTFPDPELYSFPVLTLRMTSTSESPDDTALLALFLPTAIQIDSLSETSDETSIWIEKNPVVSMQSSTTSDPASVIVDRPLLSTLISSLESSDPILALEKSIASTSMSILDTPDARLKVLRPHEVLFESESSVSTPAIGSKKKVTMILVSRSETDAAPGITRTCEIASTFQSRSSANDSIFTKTLETIVDMRSESSSFGALGIHRLGSLVPRARVIGRL